MVNTPNFDRLLSIATTVFAVIIANQRQHSRVMAAVLERLLYTGAIKHKGFPGDDGLRSAD